MGQTRAKLFVTTNIRIIPDETNAEKYILTGYKDVTGYAIEDGQLITVKTIVIANYLDSIDELLDTIESEHGKKYNAHEICLI